MGVNALQLVDLEKSKIQMELNVFVKLENFWKEIVVNVLHLVDMVHFSIKKEVNVQNLVIISNFLI